MNNKNHSVYSIWSKYEASEIWHLYLEYEGGVKTKDFPRYLIFVSNWKV